MRVRGMNEEERPRDQPRRCAGGIPAGRFRYDTLDPHDANWRTRRAERMDVETMRPGRIENRFFGNAAILKVDEGGERSAALSARIASTTRYLPRRLSAVAVPQPLSLLKLMRFVAIGKIMERS
jgi:hypothetical protein